MNTISQNKFPPNIGCLKYVHDLIHQMALWDQCTVYSAGTLFISMFVLTSCFSVESIEVYTSAFDPVDLPEKLINHQLIEHL